MALISQKQKIIVLIRPCQMIHKNEQGSTQKSTGYPQLFLPDNVVWILCKHFLIETNTG
jgi:hypothetical protein